MVDDENKAVARVEDRRELSMVNEVSAMSVKEVTDQVTLIQDIMKTVMKEGEHYGAIPGCGPKPTLLQPGAQKLILTFRMNPDYDVDIVQMARDHREYRVKCILTNNAGNFIGAGLGSCSTMETKYRYRQTSRVCPECSKDTIIKGKAEYGGGWLCFAKKGGCGAKFADDDESITGQDISRIENPDIADNYNTCLKMAKKRALVDATLTRTAASDIFTQDIEDLRKQQAESEDGSTQAPAPATQEKRGGGPSSAAPAPQESSGLIASTSYTGDWPPQNAKGYEVRIAQPDSGKMEWAGRSPSEAQRKKMFGEMRAKGYESEEHQKSLLIALYKDYGVEKDDRWTFSMFNTGHASWFIDAMLYVPIKEKDALPPWKVQKPLLSIPPKKEAATKPVDSKELAQEQKEPEPAPQTDPELIPDPDMGKEPQWEKGDPNEKEFLEPGDPGYQEAHDAEVSRTAAEGSDTPDKADEVDEDFLA